MAASPLGVLPQWTNARVTLYHGTVQAFTPSLQAGIDPGQGRRRTDFGQGFYTTTWLEQAQLRAWQLSLSAFTPRARHGCSMRAVPRCSRCHD